MSNGLLVLLVTATLGQGGESPYGGGAVYTAPDSTQSFGTGDPTYIYDAEQPWVHGYWQEIPAYGGQHFFKPYNYKHVFSQSQVAGAWGMSPNLPYSHEYFRRIYDQHALEQKTSQTNYEVRQSELAQLEPGIRAWGPAPSRRKTSRMDSAIVPQQTWATASRTGRRASAQPAAPMWNEPMEAVPQINPAAYQPGPRLTRAQELQLRMYQLQLEMAAEAQAEQAGYPANQEAVDPFLTQPRTR